MRVLLITPPAPAREAYAPAGEVGAPVSAPAGRSSTPPGHATTHVPALAHLAFLPHTVSECGPDASALLGADPTQFDVIVIDATTDLTLAATIRTRLDTLGCHVPSVAVLADGGFTAATPAWGHAQVISTHAQPAEIDARLRLAAATPTPSITATGSPTSPTPTQAPPTLPETLPPTPPALPAGLTIDYASFTATTGGRTLPLTYKEFELLYFLVTHPDRVFTRAQLVTDVWGNDYLGGTRTVDVHVRRLRAKLGPEFAHAISTVRNVGYKFTTKGLP